MVDRRQLSRAVCEWGMFASFGGAITCVALWLFPVAAWSTLVDLHFVRASSSDCSTITISGEPSFAEDTIPPPGGPRLSATRWNGFGLSFRALASGGRTVAWSVEFSTLFAALACLALAAVLLLMLRRINRAANAVG